MLNSLAITAITNILLASEVLFLAGKLVCKNPIKEKASFYWSLAFFTVGISALIGGIDHGFFEPFGNSFPRLLIQKATWLSINGIAYFVVMTVSKQFIDKKFHRVIFFVAIAQFVLIGIVAVLSSKFIIILINYAIPMLIMLVLSFISWLKYRRLGRMTIGLVLAFAAAIIQVSRTTVFLPVDHNGIYHIVMMIAVICLYKGAYELYN